MRRRSMGETRDRMELRQPKLSFLVVDTPRERRKVCMSPSHSMLHFQAGEAGRSCSTRGHMRPGDAVREVMPILRCKTLMHGACSLLYR